MTNLKSKLISYERLLLLVVLGSSLLVPFSRDLVVTAIPYMKTSLQISTFVSSLLVGAYSLGRGAGQLFSGKPTDSFGPDKLFIAGSVVLVLASLLSFYFITSIQLLIFFHFLQGAGVSTQILTSRVILQRLALGNAVTLAKLFSAKKLAAFVCGALAPTITTILIVNYGWSSLYLLTALLGSTFSLLVLYLSKRLMTIGKLPEETNLGYQQLFTNRKFVYFSLVGVVAYLWTHTYFVGVPYMLRTVFVVETYTYGLLLSLNMVAAAVGAILNILLLSYLQQIRILTGSILALSCLALGQFLIVQAEAHSLPLFIIFFGLMSICIPCITANSMGLALQAVSKNFTGRATALFGFCQFVSGFFGSFIAGFSLTIFTDPEFGLFLWFLVIAALNSLLVGWLITRGKLVSA